MKKLITFIITLSILCTTLAAKNFFSERFLEVKLGADFGISNNLFSSKDLMKKNLVIDLRKIADECPEEGFSIRANVEPTAAINLNILGLNIGLSSGVEFYDKFSVGQDLFNFLGYGNSIGQTLDFNIKNTTDVFAFAQADFGFHLGKLKIKASPALFLPILSMNDSGASLTVLNNTDGNLNIAMDMNMDIYSSVPLEATDGEVTLENGSNIFNGSYGVDIGGLLSYSFTDTLAVEGLFRIPLIPGHLKNKASVSGGFTYNMVFTDFENSEKTSEETRVSNEDAYYAVNRPLKIGLYASKDLLGTLFNARLGGGLGIQRPFCEGAYCYPEYYIGLTLNLINIVKVGLSTEYTNQLFKHQLGTTINLRVVQLDLGISSQSAILKKSFEIAGLGGYMYFTVGF
ncbi:MAG: hypothetical protein K5786_04255 [Treponema sp.]|nr:hypothetical protein [Treponema sp.]